MFLANILYSPVFLSALGLLQEAEREGTPIWVPIIIIIVIALIFLSAYFTSSGIQGERKAETAVPHDEHHPEPATRSVTLQAEVAPTAITDAPETAVAVAEETVTAVASALEPEPEPAKPDDLKIIEGIGPKIEGILHAAGIKTYAQLAAATVGSLEKIVREDAGIRVAFPDTWPEQARLAAEGAWEALEKLQDELKGGRRA